MSDRSLNAPASQPAETRLADYAPPAFLIDTLDIDFDLYEEGATVTATSRFRRNKQAGDGPAPMRLDGQNQELVSVAIDGEPLGPNRFAVDEDGLTIFDPPAEGALTIVSRNEPQNNTALEGLYKSGGNFCTQCEAEGFRRITYYPDRPDVLAVYTVTLRADKTRYPVLLSNGNPVESGATEDGRHWARWHDPFPKPSYLFALVAGDLVAIEDRFVTASGREVALAIWVRPEDRDKCDHAMRSLKKAMRWDEEVFGLEYDLDRFNIVAVSDFNMGAMENKGLNIFNTALVLARPDTATDADYRRIESVIGHEYFHNWTGNRITCRDWFQLTLKEGLTVLRDQLFSADSLGHALQRIEDVRRLRAAQFPEDAGPLAHPIRPESYIEINNFYTPTIYEKGAEVIRMIRALIGPEAFRRGMDLYIARHDGEAATCEDFLAAMADAAHYDLERFKRWYSQAGTPLVTAEDSYDAETQRYTLTLTQETPPTPGQPEKEPVTIPVRLGLLDEDGRDLPLRAGPVGLSHGDVVTLEERRQSFVFEDVPSRPTPSLFRGFSAPVKLAPQGRDRLAFLFAHDSDPFNRWEAGQQFASAALLDMIADLQAGRAPVLDDAFTAAWGRTLDDDRLAPGLKAEALTLPGEDFLAEQMAVVDVEAIHEARQAALATLGETFGDALRAAYAAHDERAPYQPSPAQMGRRALKAAALAVLNAAGGEAARDLALAQFERGTNMTDVLAALTILRDQEGPQRAQAFATFYDKWRDEPLVVDKWFMLQATSRLPDTLDRVRELTRHPAFTLKVPNRARALVAGFAQGNPLRFHRADGAGYAFLAEQVLAIEALNPSFAARLAQPLTRWRRQDPARQQKMQDALREILGKPGLSRDVYEVAAKSLG